MKLAPIGYDAFSSVPLDAQAAGLADLAQYDDPQIMNAYVREVTRITGPAYLEELRSAYGRELEAVYVALAREFAALDLELPWDRLPERQKRLLASLHPSQPAYAFQVTGALEEAIHLEICNLLRYPLALETLRLDGDELDLQVGWTQESDRRLVHEAATPAFVLRGIQGDVPEYVTLRIPTSAIESPGAGTFQIVARVVGVEELVFVDVHPVPSFDISQAGLPFQPSLEEALEQHPFLSVDPADPPAQATGWLTLQAGTWEVEGDLVLPEGYGLRATAPVTLAFGSEALLYANGPLYLDGPDAEGIHLAPRDTTWAGLLVLGTGSGASSLLRNTEVRGARGIQRDGLRTLGGATFYESPVGLDGSRLHDINAPAALHVVHADFALQRTLFANVAGHALDADLARGTVEECAFRNVRGNGIDLTGTIVDIREAHFRRVYGSAIAANQTSSVTAKHIDAADVHAAIASQDASVVQVAGLQIARAWTAGLAAFRREPAWGPASLQASQVTFQDDSVQTLAQKGSRLAVNGYEILPRDLDVKAYHRRQRTLAAMRALDHRFGSEIELLGYQPGTPEIRSGSTLTLTLYWAALTQPGRDYTVFTHLLDDAGQVAVGWDNMPCLNECPTSEWRPGRLVDDVHHIPLPADLSPGEYGIALGLYALETGERLPVLGPDDRPAPNGAVILGQRVTVRE
jgi:hypothetical protein